MEKGVIHKLIGLQKPGVICRRMRVSPALTLQQNQLQMNKTLKGKAAN